MVLGIPVRSPLALSCSTCLTWWFIPPHSSRHAAFHPSWPCSMSWPGISYSLTIQIHLPTGFSSFSTGLGSPLHSSLIIINHCTPGTIMGSVTCMEFHLGAVPPDGTVHFHFPTFTFSLYPLISFSPNVSDAFHTNHKSSILQDQSITLIHAILQTDACHTCSLTCCLLLTLSFYHHLLSPTHTFLIWESYSIILLSLGVCLTVEWTDERRGTSFK